MRDDLSASALPPPSRAGSTAEQSPLEAAEGDPFDMLPTETEIYILPGGEVIVADLPAELAVRLAPHLLDAITPNAHPLSEQARPDGCSSTPAI